MSSNVYIALPALVGAAGESRSPATPLETNTPANTAADTNIRLVNIPYLLSPLTLAPNQQLHDSQMPPNNRRRESTGRLRFCQFPVSPASDDMR